MGRLESRWASWWWAGAAGTPDAEARADASRSSAAVAPSPHAAMAAMTRSTGRIYQLLLRSRCEWTAIHALNGGNRGGRFFVCEQESDTVCLTPHKQWVEVGFSAVTAIFHTLMRRQRALRPLGSGPPLPTRSAPQPPPPGAHVAQAVVARHSGVCAWRRAQIAYFATQRCYTRRAASEGRRHAHEQRGRHTCGCG
jgi:hypothetical protein